MYFGQKLSYKNSKRLVGLNLSLGVKSTLELVQAKVRTILYCLGAQHFELELHLLALPTESVLGVAANAHSDFLLSVSRHVVLVI